MPELKSWNDLTQEISGLPSEFAAAVGTGRSGLTMLLDRPLTLEETRAVAHALAVLIDTNRELQQHCSELAVSVKNMRRHAQGMLRLTEVLLAKAEFRDEDLDEDDR